MVILGPGWLGVKRFHLIRMRHVWGQCAGLKRHLCIIAWEKLARGVLHDLAVADELHIIVGVPGDDGLVLQAVFRGRSYKCVSINMA